MESRSSSFSSVSIGSSRCILVAQQSHVHTKLGEHVFSSARPATSPTLHVLKEL